MENKRGAEQKSVELAGSLPWYTFYEAENELYAVPVTLRFNFPQDFERMAATPGVIRGESTQDIKKQLAATWGHPVDLDKYKGYNIARWGNFFFAATKPVDVYEHKFESDNAVLKAYTVISLRGRIDESAQSASIKIYTHDITSANSELMRKGGTFVKVTAFPPDVLSQQQFGSIKGKFLQQLAARFSQRTNATEPSDVFFRMHTFQQDALENRRLNAVCPVCGNSVFSVLGIPVCPDGQSAPLFFEFQCCIKFIIMIGFQPSQLIGLFTENETHFFSFLNYDHPTMSIDWDHQRFVHLISCYYLLGNEGLNAVNPIKLGFYVTFANNLGHHIRDELPTLIKLIQYLEVSKRTDASLIFGPQDFFDVYGGVPEAIRDKIAWKDESPLMVLARHCRDGRYFPSRATSDEHYYPGIGKFVIERAEKLKLHKSACMRAIEPFHKRVWFTVRNSNRRWISQIAGSAAIISAVLKRWPDACVILDGVDPSRSVISEIIKNVIDPSRCIVAVGISLLESMLLFSFLPRLGRRFGEVGPVDFSGHWNRGSIQGFDES